MTSVLQCLTALIKKTDLGLLSLQRAFSSFGHPCVFQLEASLWLAFPLEHSLPACFTNVAFSRRCWLAPQCKGQTQETSRHEEVIDEGGLDVWSLRANKLPVKTQTVAAWKETVEKDGGGILNTIISLIGISNLRLFMCSHCVFFKKILKA